jgi:hypothetical protein
MITTTFTPPPHPSADAIQAALALIAIAADPAGAKKRIDDLLRATADCRDAQKQLQDEGTRNRKALEAVADLRLREEAVAKAEGEQQAASTRLAVANSAHSEREAQLSRREAALQQKIKEHEAAVTAHVRRVEQAKAALG